MSIVNLNELIKTNKEGNDKRSIPILEFSKKVKRSVKYIEFYTKYRTGFDNFYDLLKNIEYNENDRLYNESHSLAYINVLQNDRNHIIIDLNSSKKYNISIDTDNLKMFVPFKYIRELLLFNGYYTSIVEEYSLYGFTSLSECNPNIFINDKKLEYNEFSKVFNGLYKEYHSMSNKEKMESNCYMNLNSSSVYITVPDYILINLSLRFI